MRVKNLHYTLTLAIFFIVSAAQAQQSMGIGTTTPDSKAALDITSTTKGVLFPKLTTAQQTTLAGMLSPSEMGMIVTDATTGNLVSWSGTAWNQVSATAPVTGAAPISVTSNTIAINAGTSAGDLLTWDGNNWVNKQPAVQHWTFTLENRQPYIAMNFCIAMQGIFPSRSDAVPFLSQIQVFAFNFAPVGWAMCNGQLLSISQNTALFSLLGTTYGGNGTSNFMLPDLQGRVSVNFGQGPGLSFFTQGQQGGTESNTITN